MVLFQVSVKLDKTTEGGATKKVTEDYLIDAISFGESESLVAKELAPFLTGEFKVTGIKIKQYSDVFETSDEGCDCFFEFGVSYITLDEKTGAEKRTGSKILVQAKDFHDAVKRFDNNMSGSMMDFEILSASASKASELFHVGEKADGEADGRD